MQMQLKINDACVMNFLHLKWLTEQWALCASGANEAVRLSPFEAHRSFVFIYATEKNNERITDKADLHGEGGGIEYFLLK